ncbi:hypothetical protein TCAL_16310 [Tigriopus californicus]|uniref:F-box domain-containing protein n=1 Tax=Tigriopus californicus TaxID=6832 RepID=A0A553N7L5_TIGCA|nr:hypothetical protein TCAL_16310 [Tigriopus californicus]
MQHLPNEILELIFVHLSIEDLLLSVALVCTKWRDLVQNVHVLPWKKACHRFIRRLPPENHSSTPLEAFSDVINNPLSIKQYTFANKEVNPDVVVNKTIYTLFMDPNQVLHLELALPWLVTYLSARFTLSHHQTLQLQRHSKYSLVKAVIFERFPEWWDEREDVAKGVPAAVLLSVIAYRPQHVREIIDHLLETSLRKNSENLDGPSNSPVVVLELMHAIAFGLSFFLERSDGNPVFSYNVLTALNEYEQNRDVVIPDALQLLKSPLSEQFVLGPDQARLSFHDSWYRKGFLSDLPRITDRLNPKPCQNGSPYFILTTLDNIRGMEFDRVLFYRHSPQNFFRKIPPKPRTVMINT